jgi:hypothetical protein
MTNTNAAMNDRLRYLRPMTWLAAALVALAFLGGCEDPTYDTSTPQATLAAAQKMIEDGRPDLLPTLIELQPRDITFDDGVTEASAIGDVQRKLGDMLARLWRVSVKLKNTFPDDLKKEAMAAKAAAQARVSRDIGDRLSEVFADPFEFLTRERENLTAQDMSDGTGTILWKGDPLLEGAISLIETDDGWRVTVPIELARQSGFWPETREEWAVVAYMMLGIENSLKDFERELDDGKFRTLRQASERVGRLIGESVVVQSIIYASMKQKEQGERSKDQG